MKQILIPAIVCIMLAVACNKQAGSSTEVLNEKIDTTAFMAVSTAPGTFTSYDGLNVKGSAKLYLKDGKHVIALENFSTNNGPDLHVYLSKAIQPVNFIDLGKLRSTAGFQVYQVDGMPDFDQYKYVLIHCQQYNHLFGSASLK